MTRRTLKTLVVLLLGVAACAQSASASGQRPIIGVLTVPIESGDCETLHSLEQASSGNLTSCFHSLYVKWLEAAGARAVPVRYDLSDDELDNLAKQLNGMLFTGGETPIREINSQYMHAAGRLLTHAASASDHWPLWGTCMGLQTLSILVAQDPSILEYRAFTGVDGAMLPLDLTPAATSSKLFGPASMPAGIRDTITEKNSTCNLHHDGVDPSSFEKNGRLKDFFNVLSTNVDATGKPFVSSIEAKSAPVFGVQWHPERPQFEWRPADNDPIGHSADVILAMQWFANFFVSQARMNSRKFKSPEAEAAALIYNYKPMGNDSYEPYLFTAAATSAA